MIRFITHMPIISGFLCAIIPTSRKRFLEFDIVKIGGFFFGRVCR